MKLETIGQAICKMIEKSHITPNTIRMHPADVMKLNISFFYPSKILDKPLTVFGLKIVETTRIKQGCAQIYNDEAFIEIE